MKKQLLVLFFLLTSFVKISSHPHVFIDIGLEILELNRARISWTFDPLESENKIYFFDDDVDGILSSKEVTTLYDEGFKNIQEYNYFIILKSDGLQQPVQEVSDFNAYIEEDRRLTFTFIIDLPELGSDNKLSISHFDTSYFIAFADPDKNNIILNENLFSAVLKNSNRPFYYDPNAGRGEILDTSNPKPGWIKAYLTEVFISTDPILSSFGDYKINLKESLTQLQRLVYIKLSEYLVLVREKPSAVWFILLFSLIYGVVHALGPGHRKIVISSYILSKDSISYSKAIGISIGSALIHSGTGVLSILLLNVIFQSIKPLFITNITTYLEIISYGSILVLSLVLIFLKLFRRKSNTKDKPVGLSLIILSSLVPCPGAITIMLFSLSLNMLTIGAITVLFMSLGMATTLSVISIITLKGKHLVNNSGKFKVITKILEWTGLILLLLFSIFMIINV
ncbi:MAG: DUF1007 family protein [Spirochaetaceae bacterium]